MHRNELWLRKSAATGDMTEACSAGIKLRSSPRRAAPTSTAWTSGSRTPTNESASPGSLRSGGVASRLVPAGTPRPRRGGRVAADPNLPHGKLSRDSTQDHAVDDPTCAGAGSRFERRGLTIPTRRTTVATHSTWVPREG